MKTILLLLLSSVVWGQSGSTTFHNEDGSQDTVTSVCKGDHCDVSVQWKSGMDVKMEAKQIKYCSSHPDQRWCKKHPEYIIPNLLPKKESK